MSDQDVAASTDELPTEMLELGRLIAQLPGPQFATLERQYAQVAECFRRRRRILGLVQEALSQLRLDVNYLMFDLDVTRRERDAYREELDHPQRDDFDR